MKKTLFFLLFIQSLLFANANNGNSSSNEITKPKKGKSNSHLKAPLYPTKFVFNVKFHVVKNTDGTGPTQNFGEAEMMNAMKILNTTFNQYSIFFKYRGYDVIQNTTYMKIRSIQGGEVEEGIIAQNPAHPLYSSLISYSKTSPTPVYDNSAMNLFIVETIDNNPNWTFPASLTTGYTSGASVDSAYAYDYFLSPTLPREIAKNFSLLKIYKNFNQTNCEYVNGSNATTAGDLVADTPASPKFIVNDVTNCTFININNRKDCNNTLYGTNVPVTNFMSSNNVCRNLGANYSPGTANFTPGQVAKMRAFIGLYYSNASNLYGYKNAKTDILELFKPYKVTNISGVKTHYFQKGFNYTFPSYNLTFTTNDIPTISNVTADYCLRIQGAFTENEINMMIAGADCRTVAASLLPYGKISNQVEDEVIDNVFTSGTIKSSKNLISNFYKTENLDKNQVNDPKLEENLPANEYHIITKITESGKSIQKVIYKKN